MFKDLKNIVIIVLFIVIGILLTFRQCSTPKVINNAGKVIETIKYDTIKPTSIVIQGKTKFYPKYDTIRLADTTWNQDLCKFERVYNDTTINDSNLTIYSKVNTVGLLKSIQNSYKLKIPIKIIETIKRDSIIVRQNKFDIIGNITLGGNQNLFDIYIGGGLRYNKVYYGYSYGLTNKTSNITLGIILFRSNK